MVRRSECLGLNFDESFAVYSLLHMKRARLHVLLDKVWMSAARKMPDPLIDALSVLTHFDRDLIISKRHRSFLAIPGMTENVIRCNNQGINGDHFSDIRLAT